MPAPAHILAYPAEFPDFRFGRSLCKNACEIRGLTRLPGLAPGQDGFSGFWRIVPPARIRHERSPNSYSGWFRVMCAVPGLRV